MLSGNCESEQESRIIPAPAPHPAYKDSFQIHYIPTSFIQSSTSSSFHQYNSPISMVMHPSAINSPESASCISVRSIFLPWMISSAWIGLDGIVPNASPFDSLWFWWGDRVVLFLVTASVGTSYTGLDLVGVVELCFDWGWMNGFAGAGAVLAASPCWMDGWMDGFARSEVVQDDYVTQLSSDRISAQVST